MKSLLSLKASLHCYTLLSNFCWRTEITQPENNNTQLLGIFSASSIKNYMPWRQWIEHYWQMEVSNAISSMANVPTAKCWHFMTWLQILGFGELQDRETSSYSIICVFFCKCNVLAKLFRIQSVFPITNRVWLDEKGAWFLRPPLKRSQS